MEASYFYLALVIGLFISLLMEEILGISAGGMIVPGYLAMVCDDIPQLLLIFFISFAVYLIVNHVLPHFVILFGKRKFVATLIVGILLKLILELFFPILPFATVEIRGIGAITPSLIANSYAKQGIRYSVPAVLAAAYITFGILSLLCLLF